MNRITFGILTVSDTRSTKKQKDASGEELERLVTSWDTESGAILKGQIICKDIIPDDERLIMKTLIEWCDKDKVNVILTTGGTGFSERDVTPEATRRVIYKEAPAITFAMFNNSLRITPMAMLSRAVCGIRHKTLIINFPGSPKAVAECLTTVAQVIPHAVALILGDEKKVIEDHKTIQSGRSMYESSSKLKDLEIVLKNVANRLRQSPYPMISLEETKKILYSEAKRLGGSNDVELVSVEEAHGRILADDISSHCDLPPFRASIKDGYAVIASDGLRTRKVLAGVEAGHEPGSVHLGAGHCVRVNTGAPVPDEATAVVQVEDTRCCPDKLIGTEEASVEILVAPKEGQDIRPIGSDIKKNSVILERFTKIGAVEMGILAACGITKVYVYKLPTVGILSTGNELQMPGECLKPGHVYDSNKITLIATLKENGYNSIDLGIVKDNLHTMIEGIEKSLKLVDVLITTGSVSMGDKDMLKPILYEIFGATIHFGRVNLKPGKPTTFATCTYQGRNKFFLCLPGNPVSATVTAHLFAIPLLRRLSNDYSEPIFVNAEVTTDYNLDPRPEYARAILKWNNGNNNPRAYSTGNQISSKLLSCKSANALLLLPPKSNEKSILKIGDVVSAMLLGYNANPLIARQAS